MSLNALQRDRRDAIVSALVEALTTSPDVLAIWEGGSAARHQLDDYSDIDLQIICEDDAVEHLFLLIERTLEAIDSIDKKMRIPEPTWHGHGQCFYHLADSPPTLLIDCAIMKRSAPDHFLAPEQHGHAVVHLDREQLILPPPFDAASHHRAILLTRHQLAAQFRMFHPVLVPKELARNNLIDALQFYHAYTLRPLLMMLNIVHRPLKHTFSRYTHQDFPEEVVTWLEDLYFVRDAEDLRHKHARAAELFEQAASSKAVTVEQLDAASRQVRAMH